MAHSLLHRCVSVLTALCLLLTVTACSSNQESTPSESPTATAQNSTGKVAVFLPADGVSLSQDIPLNTWQSFLESIQKNLTEQGFTDDDISTQTTSDIVKQSQDIQDYVVQHIHTTDEAKPYADAQTESEETTLIIAPAIASSDVTRYYSDYVTVPTVEEDTEIQESFQRLSSALQLAQNAGMHVILIGQSIENFTPDVFICLATAQDIGKAQAQQLVSKLRLPSATADNPKHVEIILPVPSTNSEQSMSFAQSLFAGMWQVLEPYYKSGVVISPSDTVQADSTADDWQSVIITADDQQSIAAELERRLQHDGTPQSIDGVLASNDFAAQGAIQALTNLHYTGSAADINPQISIGDIVGNITGRQDITKSPVPSPKQTTSSPTTTDEEQHTNVLQWPIITGYGAYVSNIPEIVSGKQWMTSLVNMHENAKNISQLALQLNHDVSMKSIHSLTTHAINGTDTPTLSLPLLCVSASNLKTVLIEPGYISLADAGL